MDNELTQKLYNVDWEAVIPELNRYAVSRLNILGLYPAHSCEDVVNESIMRVLNGDRKWDSDKYPDILIFMMSVIKSVCSHILESKIAEDERYKKIKEKSNDADNNDEEFYKQALEEIKELLSDDDELLLMYYSMVEGNHKDKELAEDLGVEITEIRNMKKRMRRRISSLGERLGIKCQKKEKS